jgi:hypothetical protein
MQTLPPPNLLATHPPSTRQPERRMADRNWRPESGDRKPSLDCPLAVLGPLCAALRGRIGNRVYKTYGTKIIITRVPNFEGYVPTAAQRDRRDRMRAATAFAQAVYADPAAKAVYVAAAKTLGRQPFRLAVSDFLHGRTRITPSVPCRARSQEMPADRAQGTHAAGIQHRGPRELIPAPTTRTGRRTSQSDRVRPEWRQVKAYGRLALANAIWRNAQLSTLNAHVRQSVGAVTCRRTPSGLCRDFTDGPELVGADSDDDRPRRLPHSKPSAPRSDAPACSAFRTPDSRGASSRRA